MSVEIASGKSRRNRLGGLTSIPAAVEVSLEEPASTVTLDDPVGEGQAEQLRRWSSRRIASWMRAAQVTFDALAAGVVTIVARPADAAPLESAITGTLVSLAVFAAFGFYSSTDKRFIDELRRVAGGVACALILLTQLDLMKGDVSAVAPAAGILFLFLLLARMTAAAILADMRTSDAYRSRTVVVGDNQEARGLLDDLAAGGAFNPVGCVATEVARAKENGLRVVGALDDLADVIRDEGIECVHVASSAVTAEQTRAILRVARQHNVLVRVNVALPDLARRRVRLGRGTMLAVDVEPVRLDGWRAVVKRAFDITLASLLLVVMSPVMGAIAIAVRATSPGPVLFGHERVTKNGRVFKMWKFRTMVQDADRILEQIKVSASTAFFKLEDDPRLTKLGRVLRRCSLDELPQLWNVVRGDMSLVGPRPLPVEQVKANEDFLGYRHDLPAGITGWWQINGRSELHAEEAVRLDHFYIDNWSLGLDLLILWKTARVVLKRSGAA